MLGDLKHFQAIENVIITGSLTSEECKRSLHYEIPSNYKRTVYSAKFKDGFDPPSVHTLEVAPHQSRFYFEDAFLLSDGSDVSIAAWIRPEEYEHLRSDGENLVSQFMSNV